MSVLEHGAFLGHDERKLPMPQLVVWWMPPDHAWEIHVSPRCGPRRAALEVRNPGMVEGGQPVPADELRQLGPLRMTMMS